MVLVIVVLVVFIRFTNISFANVKCGDSQNVVTTVYTEEKWEIYITIFNMW